MVTERQILCGVLAAAWVLAYLMIQSERWENQHLVKQNHHLAEENQELVAQLISASAAQRLPPPPPPPTAAARSPKCTPDGKPLGDTPGDVSVPAAVMAPKPGIKGASWFAQCPPDSDLVAVSYPVTLKSVLDPTFKFDTIETVMEAHPGTCDVFSSTFCCDLAHGTSDNVGVDAAIVSSIAAFLHYCHEHAPAGQECDAIDIGANMGTMSKYMLSTGARVRAIEPQKDLSTLVWNTACRNGWGGRMMTFNNAVTSVASEAGSTLTLGHSSKFGGKADEWGFRPDGGHRSKNAPVLSAQKIYIDEVIAAGASNLAFVKIDTDSVDDQLMQRFIQLMQAGSVTVSTFTVEEPGAATCWTMHTLGYSLYITVNVHTQFSPSPAWGAGVVSTAPQSPACHPLFPERCLLGVAGHGDQEGNR